MDRLLELKEKRGWLSDQLVKLASGNMSAEQRAQYDRLDREANELKGDIERIERAEALSAEMHRSTRPPMEPIGDSGYVRARATGGLRFEQPAGTQDSEYRQLFDEFLRSGEKRSLALSTATQSTATSVLVPQDFARSIETAMLYSGPMLKIARVYPTQTGAPLPWPTSDDTGNAASIVGEGSAVSEVDATLSSVVFGAFKYSTGLVTVSLELLQDANFDLYNWLSEQFGRRLGRKLNTDFTVGAGTTEPYGLVTQATSGRTAVGSATNTGGAEDGTDTIGTDDLLALIHSVDVAYRQGAVFQAHDDTIRSIMSLKDKQGRPLFQPVDAGQMPSIFGYSIYPNNDLDQLATGNKTVVFGDHQKYVIRQARDLSVLRLVERYAEKGQVGFIGFARFDGNLIDAGTHPVKYITQA